MSRARRALGLVAAGAFIVLSLGVNPNRRRPLEEVDEAAWILSSYYARLATPAGVRSPDWARRDALDHPPLAKLAFGAALAPLGLVPSSIEPKERWLDESLAPGAKGAFLERCRAWIPGEALARARAVSAAAAILACLLLGGLALEAFGPATAALAAAFMAAAPLIRQLGALAVADALFLLAILAAAAASCRAAEEPRSWARAALAGALCGAAFDVKIAGGAALVLLWAALAASRRPGRARAAAAAGAAAFVAAVALNPTLWRGPLSTALELLRYRAAALDRQAAVFPGDVVAGWADRLSAYFGAVFRAPDAVSRLTSGLTALCAGLGVAGALESLPRERPAARAAWVQLAGWALLALLTLRMRWARYAAPAVPFFSLLAARGAVRAWEDGQRRMKTAKRLGLPASWKQRGRPRKDVGPKASRPPSRGS